MKSRVHIALFAALFITAMSVPALAQATGEPVTVTFKVTGFHCPVCANHLQSFLQELDGVIEASTSFEESRLTVTFDPGVQSVETLQEAVVEHTGFSIEEIPSEAEVGASIDRQ